MPGRRWTSPLRRVLVAGPSMAPTLRHGDQVLAWLRRPDPPRVGSVVVVDLPDGSGLAVKRVLRVGADGAVWVEGDNPFGSTDSHHFGELPAAAVRGRVLVRLWPRPGRLAPMTGHPRGDV